MGKILILIPLKESILTLKDLKMALKIKKLDLEKEIIQNGIILNMTLNQNFPKFHNFK